VNQNQILFSSWLEMFDGRGAPLNSNKVPIYSFNDVDVMRDPSWPVSWNSVLLCCILHYSILFHSFALYCVLCYNTMAVTV